MLPRVSPARLCGELMASTKIRAPAAVKTSDRPLRKSMRDAMRVAVRSMALADAVGNSDEQESKRQEQGQCPRGQQQ